MIDIDPRQFEMTFKDERKSYVKGNKTIISNYEFEEKLKWLQRETPKHEAEKR